MDRREKKLLRERIGRHLDVRGTRMTDEEAVKLDAFLNSYDSVYRDVSEERIERGEGFSSDGRYRYVKTTTYSFSEEPGVQIDELGQYDDGSSWEHSEHVNDARGVLNILKNVFSDLGE